jgi:hypothetical protein
MVIKLNSDFLIKLAGQNLSKPDEAKRIRQWNVLMLRKRIQPFFFA